MWVFAALVFGFLGGIILTLLLQWQFIRRYFTQNYENIPTATKYVEQQSSVVLPEELIKILGSTVSDVKESCLSLNLIFQFLFNELHDTDRVRRWFIKKLSVEFEELLQGTTTGKLLEQITIQDLYFGTHFPIIKSSSVKNLQMHSLGYIQELDIAIDLEYSGGFQLSISADMVFGRSAFLAVKVSRLHGQAQLRFTRIPYTHWSFAFCEEPQMDLRVESHFQGRPLPKITSLIVNQIRRAVRKRHSLPNYKIRYKPFFVKPETPSSITNQSMRFMGGKLTEGVVEVKVVECSRLFLIPTSSDTVVYCTLAIDFSSWVDSTSLFTATWISRDIEVVRTGNQNVGLTFKQEFILERYENCVIVDSVASNSPACLADIKRGDILVAVNGSKVTSARHVVKFFKQPSDMFSVHIERRSSLQTLMDESVRDDESTTSGSHGAGDDEADDSCSTDSGSKSPAVKSPLSQSPIKKSSLKSSPNVNSLLAERLKSGVETNFQHYKASNVKTSDLSVSNRKVVMKKTTEVKFTQDPKWNETITFEVADYNNYLNVCVWQHALDQKSDKTDRPMRNEKDVVLGHISILLADVATECAFHRQGYYRKTFQLRPPEPKPVASRTHKLSRHPGFDESQCYGDITLAFTYKPKVQDKEKQSESETLKKENVSGESEDEGFSILPEVVGEEGQHNDHDFIITQFPTTVFCKFCGKKVWFKLAFQCRSCNVVCHKKCVTKFRAATSCSREGIQLKSVSVQPEIITSTTEASHAGHPNAVESEDTSSSLESPRTQRRLRTLLSSLASSTKSNSTNLSRVGSVHNLALPSVQPFTVQSKSLPPSPQSSPGTSRKTSLQESLFQTGPDFEMDEDLDVVIQRLLQYSNDEMLVSMAKEKGRDLFADLSLEERRDKLNAMIGKLQMEIDLETENRNILYKEEQALSNTKEKTRASYNIGKSNEKIQALAVLMLYYCSGLQHCQEIDDSLKKTAANSVVF